MVAVESVPARGFGGRESDGGVENGFGDAEGGASLVELRGTEDAAEGFGGEREVRVMTSRGDCEAMLGEVVWNMREACLYFFFFFLRFLVPITSGHLSHRLVKESERNSVFELVFIRKSSNHRFGSFISKPRIHFDHIICIKYMQHLINRLKSPVY